MQPQTPRLTLTPIRSIAALMLREMSTTYGRTLLGYLWSLAEPVGGIILLTVVFGFVAAAPALGDSFPLFFATGVLPFMAYQATAANVGQSIRFSRQLLAYPNVSFIDTLLARFILTVVVQTIVAGAVLAAIILWFGLRLDIEPVLVLQALAMSFALGAGVGTLNCVLNSLIPSWPFVWAVLNRPLFLITGIFFLVDQIPPPFRDLLALNPLTHPVMRLREGFYGGYTAPLISEPFVYLVSLSLLVTGLVLLWRHHDAIVEDAV